jgi:hypothetical protein
LVEVGAIHQGLLKLPRSHWEIASREAEIPEDFIRKSFGKLVVEFSH